jgi:hypothetical protein
MAKVYPGFPCLIDQPSAIVVDGEETLTLGDKFVLKELKPNPAKNANLAASVSRLYPNATQEMQLLKCDTAEYRKKIMDLMLAWTSKNNVVRKHEVKYIPPGYEKEWKEAMIKKKPFPENKYVNALAINKSFSLIAIKINEKDDFTIAFSLLNGQMPGFYRSTELKLKFVAGACFIENLGAGFIATATQIYHFEITENSEFKILATFANPTYPKKVALSSAESLEHDYPILLMQSTTQFLVVARYNSCPMFIGARSHVLFNSVPIEITSMFLAEHEFSCGTSSGDVRTFLIRSKANGQPGLRINKKKSFPLCKTWNCFNQLIDIAPQEVVLQQVVGNFYIYVLKRAIITIDRTSKTIAINNEIEPIFSATVIGDLLITMATSHTLFFTQVGQSLPVKKTKLSDEEVVGAPGRTLLYADLFGIWVLCSSGTLIKVELPIPD